LVLDIERTSMANKGQFVTDEHWWKLKSLLPQHKLHLQRARRQQDHREVFENIAFCVFVFIVYYPLVTTRLPTGAGDP
jgi:hypothetical protein